MRQVFTLDDGQYETLLKAMKPVPQIMLQCGPPPSVQECANAAWKRLGDQMGFRWETVRPHGSSDRVFSAELSK